MANFHAEPQLVESSTFHSSSTGNDVEKDGSVQVVYTVQDKNILRQPAFWDRFPFYGFGALLGVLCCSVACLIVVYLSDDKEATQHLYEIGKNQWPKKIAPNVVLSILSSVAAILITFAVGEGIAISWWRKAMKGATVQELHYSWSFGTSIWDILTKYKLFNTIALAAVCTKFAILDSTLYQKATSTYPALGQPHEINTHNAQMFYTYPTEEFPVTGVFNIYGNDTDNVNFDTSISAALWASSASTADVYSFYGFQGCNGTCALKYTGVGFASMCSMSNTSVNRDADAVQSGDDTLMQWGFEHVKAEANKDYSFIRMNLVSWSNNNLINGTYGGSNPTCGGQLLNVTCELRPAVLEYPIYIQSSTHYATPDKKRRIGKSADSSVSLSISDIDSTGQKSSTGDFDYDADGFPMVLTQQQISNITVVEYLSLNESFVPGAYTSLGGIALLLESTYGSSATVQYSNATEEVRAQPVIRISGNQPTIQQEFDSGDNCPLSYSGIQSYGPVLYQINLLTLLLSDNYPLRPSYNTNSTLFEGYGNLNSSSMDASYFDSNYTQDHASYSEVIQYLDSTYYQSNLTFAWCAFGTTLLVIFLIMPAYWGFWELERKVTMGPFEIANAFGAPAFIHPDTGPGHVNNVLKSVGGTHVQYAKTDQDGRPSYRFVHRQATMQQQR